MKNLLSKMIEELQMNFSEYDDCGEVNCTKLAENMAEAHDLYEDNVDYEIPEHVFEQAFIASERFLKDKNASRI